jgi:hypothetical protein
MNRADVIAAALETGTYRRLRDALSDVYQTIGPDLGWVEDTPSDEEFVDVLRDQLWNFTEEFGVTDADMKAWQTLTPELKRLLILEVGP